MYIYTRVGILLDIFIFIYKGILVKCYDYESTSAIGTKKLLIACRFFDNDKYERSEIEWRREQ